MIYYDSQYSEGECSRESSPDLEALNASPGYGSQGEGYSSQGTGAQEFTSQEFGTQQESSRQSLQGMASQNLEQIKSQAMQKGNEITQQVKSRASSYLDQQKSMAANVLRDVTEVTRHCGDELQQRNHPRLGETIKVVADRMDDFCNSLRRQDTNYFVNRTQEFARQRPMLFLGGALALGFLAVRFLKSSQQPSGSRFESVTEPSQESYGIHNEMPASSGTQFTI